MDSPEFRSPFIARVEQGVNDVPDLPLSTTEDHLFAELVADFSPQPESVPAPARPSMAKVALQAVQRYITGPGRHRLPLRARKLI